MSQIKTELKKHTRPQKVSRLSFKNLNIAMKNDLFRLNIVNNEGERVYVADTEYIQEGVKIYMTDGTEFKLIKG